MTMDPDEELRDRLDAYLQAVPEQLNYLLPTELERLLRESPERIFVLDNRTPEAYSQGHIPGAVNIWMKDVLKEESLARIPTDALIVVCCWVGHTASQLLPILGSLGFR